MEISNLTITEEAFTIDPILFNKLYNTEEEFSKEEIIRLFVELFCYDIDSHSSGDLLSSLLRSLFKPQIVVYSGSVQNNIGTNYPIELLKDKVSLLEWLRDIKNITVIDEVKIIAPLCKVNGIDPIVEITDYSEVNNVSQIELK
jgi:hypothetical protein